MRLAGEGVEQGQRAAADAGLVVLAVDDQQLADHVGQHGRRHAPAAEHAAPAGGDDPGGREPVVVEDPAGVGHDLGDRVLGRVEPALDRGLGLPDPDEPGIGTTAGEQARAR